MTEDEAEAGNDDDEPGDDEVEDEDAEPGNDEVEDDPVAEIAEDESATEDTVEEPEGDDEDVPAEEEES